MENSTNSVNVFMAALIFEKSRVPFNDLFRDEEVDVRNEKPVVGVGADVETLVAA